MQLHQCPDLTVLGLRWLAHGEAPNRLRGLGYGVDDLLAQLLWVDVPMMQIWDRSRFGIVGTF
jgi:uncharacterized protein YebE (UPF0316 family)